DVTEHQLVGLAATHSPKELRAAAKQLCDRIDFDGPEPEEHKAYARESLTLRPAENGVKFTGFLANENAELLRAIVHTGARPHKTADGEHDPRPRDKRQADALTTALTVAANAWDTDTAGHGAKANITVTIDLDDLKSATAHATGQTIYGDDLSAATIRRLACDANVIPLVLGSDSQPLDVGRRERLVTRHIRHALVARDRGCVVCAAPPVMCDAHHLISWLDGGATSIANLALLCRRHHVDLHNNRWTITITNGQVHVARPAWADPPGAAPAGTAPPGAAPGRAERPDSRPRPAEPNDSPGAVPAWADPPGVVSAWADPSGVVSAWADPSGAVPAWVDPPGAAPGRAERPDSRPRPAEPNDPSGAVPAGTGLSGAVPAGTGLSGVVPAGTDPSGVVPGWGERSDSRARPGEPDEPPGDAWGDTAVPAARGSRWEADEATLTAAARFAVWGERAPTGPATGPPSFVTV
ncbi:HNH endonuclease, partial [Kribbella karoonensis]|uniref:HNH endonuclease n=1 Tax=Kribbella karoonensis TaxID=324851 RepID=UPI0031D50120